LGAIRDISLFIENKQINEDLMIIGGDTLFFDDFLLIDVIRTFNERKDNLVLWYQSDDTLRTGILETDDKSCVINFLEKPKPEATKSRQACPCFYIFRKNTLPLFPSYCSEAKTLQQLDAPGNFIPYLIKNQPTYAYRISGRFDIGGLDTYIECNNFFTKKYNTSKNPINTSNTSNTNASNVLTSTTSSTTATISTEITSTATAIASAALASTSSRYEMKL